jgi:Rrf2 family protein
MLRPPRKLIFALEAVIDIAYNARPEPVQSKEITRRQGIPNRYLEQVMQQLVRYGVLKGVRGPRGGYTLARERRHITVGQVVRAIAQADLGAEKEEALGSAIGRKVLRPLWDRLQNEFLQRLDAITLEDLCRDVQASGIKQVGHEISDFSI